MSLTALSRRERNSAERQEGSVALEAAVVLTEGLQPKASTVPCLVPISRNGASAAWPLCLRAFRSDATV